MSRKNARLTLKHGQEIFDYLQKNPGKSIAATARHFDEKFKAVGGCCEGTVSRIKAGTWRPKTLKTEPVPPRAMLVKPGSTLKATSATLPASQFQLLTGELNAALGLLNETATKMGFEAVVHFKGK